MEPNILEGERAYNRIKHQLIEEGDEGHWALFVGGELKQIERQKRELLLAFSLSLILNPILLLATPEGDFFLVRVGKKSKIQIRSI